MNQVECLIVGAGQCGLYAAKCLQDAGVSYAALERNSVGDVWRNRLEGMKLFTSRRFCALPGMEFPGVQGDFPDVGEVAEYLRCYKNHFELNVVENCAVEKVEKTDKGFEVTTSSGESILALSIVNATGSNQVCVIPEIASTLDESVLQATANISDLSGYSSDQHVVVVGAGASGRQIAGRLADKCKSVVLSVGDTRGLPPNKVLGKDIFWWLKKLGILFASSNSLVAKILKKRNPVPCGDVNNSKLQNKGVKIVGKTIACERDEFSFSCGTKYKASAVVWAVGYRDETNWLDVKDAVQHGEFVHSGVLTPVPGLFVVGKKWLSCRASELIMGVEKDVNTTLDQVLSHIRKVS